METESTTSEEKLVKAAKENNPEAIATLYDTYKGLALRLSLLHVGNYQDAEDIALTALEKSILKISQLKNDHDYIRWLCTIVRRELADFYRKSYKYPVSFTPLDPELEDIPDNENDDTLVDTAKAIEEISSGLNSRQKAAFLLLVRGFTPYEISSQLNISRVAGRSLIMKTRIKIRKHLLEKGCPKLT